MTATIPIRRDSLQRQLEIHRNNLAALEEQAATYGLQIPLNVHNEMVHARQQIDQLESLLATAAADGAAVDVDIDSGLDTLLRAMTLIQQRMDAMLRAYLEDRERVAVLWRRAHPSIKHRLSIGVAVGFVALTCILWYIKEFRDVFLTTPLLAVLVTAALLAVGPMVYLFGRDDPYGNE